MTLQEAIDALENDPREIADIIRAEEIRGDILKSETCPLAIYLSKKIKATCYVGSRTISTSSDNFDLDVFMSERMYQFRQNFDLGKYPDLVRRYYMD